MDKRTFLFVTSTLLIWMVYFAISGPSPQPSETVDPALRETPVPVADSGGPSVAGSGSSGTAAAIPPVELPAYEIPAAAAERAVVVETPLYQAEVSTRGAVLTA